MSNPILARLEALAAEPKPWLVTIHCDNANHMATKRGFVSADVEYRPE